MDSARLLSEYGLKYLLGITGWASQELTKSDYMYFKVKNVQEEKEAGSRKEASVTTVLNKKKIAFVLSGSDGS